MKDQDVRRLSTQVRLLGAITGLLLVAVVWLFLGQNSQPGVTKPEPVEELIVKRLTIQNDEGQVVAELAAAGGGATLKLHHESGEQTLELTTEKAEPIITLNNQLGGGLSLRLFVTNGGSAISFLSGDGPVLHLGRDAKVQPGELVKEHSAKRHWATRERGVRARLGGGPRNTW